MTPKSTFPEDGPPFVVLRAHDIDLARHFFERLGLHFTEERHGTGPRHFAAVLPTGVVLELYPAKPPRR